MQYKRVALAIVAHEYAHGREKIKGIIDYYRKHSAWEIHRNELAQPYVMPESLVGWDGDGVIGEIYTGTDAANLGSLKIPLVNTSSNDAAREFPTVGVDNHAIGQMAAEHLVECKLDRFAFVGLTGLCHVRERYEGFSQILEKNGGNCTLVQYQPEVVRGEHVSEELVSPERLMDALRDLELPVGIMTSSDRVGFAVLEACRRLGLRSPEDVALIGVDNDEMYCNLAYSSMTSIAPNARAVGFKAAAMLDKLMNGEELARSRILIPPKRIIFRNSTDMTRSEYPEVARALRFIRNHANEFIDVTNVLDVVPVSRRWLEMKFKDEVGHGIYQEIRRVHVERARELLLTTDWPVSRVAKESGFNNTERFEFAFQKLLEMSATEFRRQQAQG
ncbi:Xylose operon regulatory protein [Pontiella desulfatans]|uniref:Xylose operon regulatory protein n=2 Tax=Pontiella desulfatans TaxID=2750659 RepID=A0A6C2U2R5_PONDE|nr:Xylose operon regulatory protein [Pontiella desulfatans]